MCLHLNDQLFYSSLRDFPVTALNNTALALYLVFTFSHADNVSGCERCEHQANQALPGDHHRHDKWRLPGQTATNSKQSPSFLEAAQLKCTISLLYPIVLFKL